jgi:hypothetical protein
MTATVSAPLEDDAMVDDGFADDVRVRLLVLRCIRLERLLEQARPHIEGAPRGLVTAIENALKEGA